MKLQGRDLAPQMRGPDVELLQTELNTLGWKVERDGVFASRTLAAVLAFQRISGILQNGIINEITAKAINEAIKWLKKKKFKIRGQVIDRKTRQGLPGLRVEAWDKDLIVDDKIEEVVTREDGNFLMTFDESKFRELLFDRKPDLFFRIYRDKEFIKDTKDSVLWNVKPGDTELPAIEVEETKKLPNTYVVHGEVRLHDGTPLSQGIVMVSVKELTRESKVGAGRIDAGVYRVEFEYAVPGESKINPNILVHVFSLAGELLARSSIIFGAQPEQRIDIDISKDKQRAPSEFERMVRTIQPLLQNGLTFADLEQDEQHDNIRFLAGKTGLEVVKIARLSLAHRLSNDSKIKPEFWYAVLALGFQEISENLSLQVQYRNIRAALPSLDAPAVRKALISAFRENVIHPADDGQVAGWIAEFLEYAASQVIAAGDAATTTFVKQALEEAGITTANQQLKFSKLFQQFRGFSPAFVEELSKDESFKASEIADIHTSFRLAEVTNADFSVVKVIKKEFDVHQPDAIRSVAKKSEQEWISVVDKNVKSGDLKLPFEITLPAELQFQHAALYGKQLSRQFQEAFPTSAFSGGLQRALQSGHPTALKQAQKLNQFLNANPEFEILNTSIDAYLQSEGRPDLDDYKNDAAFQLELKAVQRVFKLSPSFEATDTLLVDDLHSAQKIYRLGEAEFVRKYRGRPGFDEKSARKTWNKAADTHAAVVTLVSELKDLENAGAVLALRSGNEAVSNFPNWNNLFRTGDICECEHCRSVLSPAAYFADLLMFLKDRKAKNPAFSVKDILLKRRPDLGYIELNCENALTTLPYIDVVCEVLENVAAAGENDLELPGLAAIDPNMAQAKTDVQNAFQAKGISMGSDFTLSQAGTTGRWVLHHDDITYLLKKKTTANYFAEILRNTKAKAEELRANPQYVNPKAYNKLKAAKYPLALPFDLFNEEVQAVFRKAGLKRWELMQIFRGTAAPNNPGEGDIAAEFFGISVDDNAAIDEKRIITQARPANRYEFWGEPDNATMIANLTNVKTFLQKTGIEYNDLLTLLDLKFINTDGSIQIVHLDATCDTEQKEIRTLDENKLDRIHRFLRLWRKLKDWKMWEVDLVIRHSKIGNGNLNEPFLVNLMYFVQTKDVLSKKMPVEQLCSLFGNINTETRFTKLHQKREDALYQNLFLNRKLIHPLDLAFEIDPATNDIRIPTDPVTGNPVPPKLSEHLPVVIAALRIKESDLSVYTSLTKASDGANYINDELTLSNLSFLYRHSWLAKQLKFKAEEWKTLLKLLNQDMAAFANPQAAKTFIEKVEVLRQTGFSVDELNYLLSADRQAKAAVNEQNAGRFLLALRKELQGIAAEYDAAKYPFLQAAPPTEVEQLTALLTILLQKLNRNEQAITSIQDTFQDSVSISVPVQGLPAGFDFPAAIKNTIRIRCEKTNVPTNYIFGFTGLMLPAEQNTLKTDPALAAVIGMQAYQDTIDELYWLPRLALKFYEPFFTAPLNNLPGAIDFKQQLPADLSAKIAFDAEQRLLRFSGIMTHDEKVTLENLSADADYLNSVDSLYTQPKAGAFSPDELWIQDADLSFPLRDLNNPANDNLAQNLATACQKAIAYLKNTQSENALIQQLSTQLGLTAAVVRKLVTTYQLIPPDTILQHFTKSFATSSGAIDYSSSKDTFDTYFWLYRVSLIVKKWKIELTELEWMLTYHVPTQTLDFKSLPIDSTKPVAPLDTFIRTSRLFRFRERLDESQITLLKVLEKLHTGAYPANADFANDVYLLKEWNPEDVKKLTESLDLIYPAGYLLAENWERLNKAFDLLDKLNAGTDQVKAFANPTVGEAEAKTLKQLLRAKFGAESWLTLSAEIQDVLRERKRDALVAWLLTQTKPVDAPSGKWENTNDVYAYYLLDVETSSCMLTSRLVQASGSVQLFVQRCMMGLEPEIVVKADGDDGDSAWRWWKWMRKYRVWEANRKIFLYPENWIEPELRRDKSSFFRDLENELLQNEVNQYTVETAFLNYLEKLDGVAQLEIAGFYHEDDADRTIIHVFGRTKGAEPHIYHYRQYDYRRWTPWEKVDLDIAGDYLIPTVVNKRLFLFWPVFTEVPDEANNKTVPVPPAKFEGSTQDMPKTMKKLKLQMTVSEFRNGKWTPKKVSKDAHESRAYFGEIIKKFYTFRPVDRTDIDDDLA